MLSVLQTLSYSCFAEISNHIFFEYELPLLRLSTKGSGERDKLTTMLNQLVLDT